MYFSHFIMYLFVRNFKICFILIFILIFFNTSDEVENFLFSLFPGKITYNLTVS